MTADVLYYDPANEPRPPFRQGEAGVVWVSESDVFEYDTRVHISPNSYHALFAHGVIDALARLPLQMGPLEEGAEAVLAPSALSDALRIFYDADRYTYGARHDLLVAAAWGTPIADYRIAVDNRELQRTLSQLQYLTSQASRMGHGVRLRL